MSVAHLAEAAPTSNMSPSEGDGPSWFLPQAPEDVPNPVESSSLNTIIPSIPSTPTPASWSNPTNGLPSRNNFPRKRLSLNHRLSRAQSTHSTQLSKVKASSPFR